MREAKASSRLTVTRFVWSLILLRPLQMQSTPGQHQSCIFHISSKPFVGESAISGGNVCTTCYHEGYGRNEETVRYHQHQFLCHHHHYRGPHRTQTRRPRHLRWHTYPSRWSASPGQQCFINGTSSIVTFADSGNSPERVSNGHEQIEQDIP